MATASQLTALIRFFRDNDKDRFVSTALQVAAHEARLGHSAVAAELNVLIEGIKKQNLNPATQTNVVHFKHSAELTDLALVAHPDERLAELVLPNATMERIKRVLTENRQHSKLLSHGLSPRRKVLLAGPPGTGKTMTAKVLAGELHLPLYTVMMDRLVTKFMGETSAKLRQIFECIADHRGVYLFDEFDAIGADRGRDNDVGEMRRVLNNFLQFLEQDNSMSLIIAATNASRILDPALFRRFDDILHFDKPNDAETIHLIKCRLATYWNEEWSTEAILKTTTGLSHAEIVQACDDAVKDIIINDQAAIDFDTLVKSIEYRRSAYK
ncbi:AAA family ATPase [Nitratidesulfovibrio vulgaris]|uniref:AAA ATPase, central domain protein n=1 Tax=Nitratidesulfovibrio vulgaris (strain DP4) TaxID=391774 RepID=A0A0H3ABI7_NITV4|nr:ATP-binding protein [Nitratidesulfovibrio vulgaris]ABM29786.1 AAA ATPase, central domain protein [Nitratidesulfovibrio vulgaris DP4]